MTGQPVIVTERLELWHPQRGDIDQTIAIVMQEHTRRFLGANPTVDDNHARFLRQAGSWMIYGYGGLTVRERGKAPVIGSCGIFHSRRGLGDRFDDMPEAGWIIAAEHEGKGYATEAMRAAIDLFARDHGPARIMCIIDADNAASNRLAGKLGFEQREIGTLPDGSSILIYDRMA
ncbi:GNAT family N-acetyltransferase [Croceicoccus ponticola]|nr:GNAT family N-acetyltransferase [Croceicoccus ponticola]